MIADSTKRLKTYAEAQVEALEYIRGRREGEITSLVTPWKKFNDAHIDGIEMQRIITIGGMSGSGKSLIGNQIEKNLHILNPREDFMILNFNFEMASRDIIIRGIIADLNIDNRELLSADAVQLDDHKFEQVKIKLQPSVKPVDIFYCEYPQTTAKYYEICHAFYGKYQKKFITMSDHSNLFKKGAAEKSSFDMLYALGDASIQLKKELPCTQIHFSQLNRDIEDQGRRIKNSPLNYPGKSDIFGSDSLYMCSDTVMINHRPSLLDFPVNSYGPGKLPTGPTDLYWHFLKLRQGSPHIAHMRGDFAHMKIYDN